MAHLTLTLTCRRKWWFRPATWVAYALVWLEFVDPDAAAEWLVQNGMVIGVE